MQKRQLILEELDVQSFPTTQGVSVSGDIGTQGGTVYCDPGWDSYEQDCAHPLSLTGWNLCVCKYMMHPIPP